MGGGTAPGAAHPRRFLRGGGLTLLARVHTAALVGIRAHPVQVEVDVRDGLPTLATVGLPDEAVRESRDRVRAAIANSGFAFPAGRVTVNLAPADLRKAGSAYDLAIAVGVVAAQGLARLDRADGLWLLGELSLDGGLRAVRGVLPAAIAARDRGCRGLLVPLANAAEAALVRDVEVYPAASLRGVLEFLNGERPIAPQARDVEDVGPGAAEPEAQMLLEDVRGQELAKRALEIAAAGGHNLLLQGSPGAGKTMLSRCLPGILPPLSFEEALETTGIHSVAGLISPGSPLVRQRPFRAPHHTVSHPGLVGGGARPRPGEISLAHNGVLFLDELPEFSRRALESLRQPLEAGEVVVSRACQSVAFPARFVLVAAMNPCPCGFLGDRARDCVCTGWEIARYRARVSGPLLDRVDLHVEVPAVGWGGLAEEHAGEGTVAVRERVVGARALAQGRLAGTGARCNGELGPRQLREHCLPDAEGRRLLEGAARALRLSARGHARVLKVARTIADLAGDGVVRAPHVAEAVQYRGHDAAPG